MSSFEGNATLTTSKGDHKLTHVRLVEFEDLVQLGHIEWPSPQALKGWYGTARCDGDEAVKFFGHGVARITPDGWNPGQVVITELSYAVGDATAILTLQGIGPKPWQES